ncbi:hypothetical protein [Silvimonas iriomotensis]|uniref:Flagellar hook-associated protein 1 n=1 Tax=Silvimonas iriomotensis TaxID=449662 RepID=A0ABQ2PAR6_9NEIS|nr:hypothetical protein [Silvimonas iriomotensis]GGP22307.1 hypothetical protein GCM10010970_24580 [Silvimonas iriomotensis]
MSVSYIPTTGGSTLSLGQTTPRIDASNTLTGVNPQIAPQHDYIADFENDMVNITRPAANRANTAIQTIYDQLTRVQANLAQQHPQIANSNWDVVLQDGKLKVTGKLSDSDRAWLENALNANTDLVNAARSYSSAIVTYFQGTPDHQQVPSLMGQDGRAYDSAHPLLWLQSRHSNHQGCPWSRSIFAETFPLSTSRY